MKNVKTSVCILQHEVKMKSIDSKVFKVLNTESKIRSTFHTSTFISTIILFIVVHLNCGKQARMQSIIDEKPAYGGTFRLAQFTPETLDPIFIDDVYESSIANQIFDGLLKFDVNLRPIPAIAKEWTISPDRRTYTFTLRRGVLFHNGRELTADDCVYSFTRIFNPSLPFSSIATEFMNDIVGTQEYSSGRAGKIKGLTALDTHTLEIVLRKPSTHFLTVLAMDNTKVVPKEIGEEKGFQKFGKQPWGTGPFRFISWDEQKRIVLVAHDQYFGGRPYLDSLIFEIPHTYNEDELVEKFFNGDLETIAVPVGKLEQFMKENSYTIVKGPELSIEFIGFNTQLPPLDNKKVRQAIAHALNRQKLIGLDPESFVLASGILPPGMPGYSPTQTVYPYNPKKANELLREAGLCKGRKQKKIEYWGVGTDSMSVYENDLMVKGDLAQIGLDLEQKYESWLEFDKRVAEGRAQLFSMSLIADIPEPASFLYSIFHSSSGTNYLGYSNTLVDSILKKAKEELNYFERVRMCREAEKLIMADAPIVPLDHVINIYAFQPYVKGIELSPYGMADFSMEKIWIRHKRYDTKSKIQLSAL